MERRAQSIELNLRSCFGWEELAFDDDGGAGVCYDTKAGRPTGMGPGC